MIFKTTGTPSIESWPTLEDLPWYELVKPTKVVPSRLREVYSKSVLVLSRVGMMADECGCRWMTPGGLDVAEQLLCLDPAGRPNSETVLEMPYFTTEDPQPELPDMYVLCCACDVLY